MDLNQFADNNAGAIIFPYIREIIASTTLKSGINPIILQPLNIPALIKQSKEKKKK